MMKRGKIILPEEWRKALAFEYESTVKIYRAETSPNPKPKVQPKQ